MKFDEAAELAFQGEKIARPGWKYGNYWTRNSGPDPRSSDLPFRRFYPDGSNGPWMTWREKRHRHSEWCCFPSQAKEECDDERRKIEEA